MSPPGRPKGEYRSAQHEGTPASPPGRPKGEYRSAQHEGTPASPPGRPKGEYRNARHEAALMSGPGAHGHAAGISLPLAQLRAADVAPQPWRNGGGRTRELLAWPAGAGWRLRLSLADIDADGPFSAFPGVQRWFAVVAGAGVELALPDRDAAPSSHRRRSDASPRRLTTASEPLCFDGAEAPECCLLEGPTRDLNLMLRGGARGCLRRAADGATWGEPWPWRACFTTGAARWQGGDGPPIQLDALTLLCHLGPAPCRLVARDAEAPMFWIGVDIGPSGAST